jgi:cytochrome c553
MARSFERRALIRGTVLACAVLAAGSVFGADARPPQVETCLGCHGIENYTNAYPTYPVPKVGGQRPEYIVAALKAYASGERQHDTMHAQAAELSDDAMQAIAEWFAAEGPGEKQPSSEVR